ncbi:MAG: HAMP domain-containing protein [Desulfobacteraceae bacterium]|nr:HAMP domain-containing protein [Desulfobacteraceae bacterium]
MAILGIKKLSLKARFISSFIFVIIVTIAILSVAQHVRWYDNYMRQLRDEGLILTQTMVQGGLDPIIKHDFFTLREHVRTLMKNENIAYILITDRYRQILAQSADADRHIPEAVTGNKTPGPEPYIVQTYYNPHHKSRINDILVYAKVDDEIWGAVRIGFSLNHIRTEIKKNIMLSIFTGLVSICIGVLVAMLLSRFVTGPIEKFIRSTRIIAGGDLEQKIQISTMDEFGTLAASFNHMAYSLRRSKEELKQTYQNLIQKEKMAALGELAARIAHEIKNPLGIIKGSAQIVTDDSIDDRDRAETLGYIIEEVDRLDEKIHILLNRAKPDAVDIKAVNVNEVLEDSIRFWESQRMRDYKITISRQFDPGLPMIFIDKEHIRQIALNIIINACEAMPKGGSIKISTRLEPGQDAPASMPDGSPRDNGVMVIGFEDTGPGIAEDLHDKIFVPFFTTKEHGTGLGLSNVSRIINNYHGKISVSTAEEAGAVFTIYLPIS